MRHRSVWMSVLLVAVAGGSAAYYLTHRPAATPTITTALVTRGDVVDSVEATGTLQAVTTVQVGTQVSGAIKALHADFNSRVRRGQVIAELEPSLFEAQVAQARASLVRLQADAQRTAVQLDDAQRKLARARELWDRKLIAAMDLEAAQMTAQEADASVKSAEAQVTQARASLNQAEVNLAHTIIAAPIDGVVISRNVDVGQTVAASMQAPTLFVIARDLGQMQVNASVAEADIGRIQQGQSVSFRVDAYPNARFTGTVSQVRLQPVVEQNVVSYVTVINVPNTDLRLKPGMTATVTIEVERAANVLRVPNAALRVRPPGETGVSNRPRGGTGDVWIQGGTGLTRIPVSVGISDGAMTAVTGEGLREGAAVVTSIASAAAAAPATSTNPLVPTFRGRGAGGAPATAGGRRSGN